MANEDRQLVIAEFDDSVNMTRKELEEEEGSGKLEAPTPPDGIVPQVEETPAVVDEDSPPGPPRC